MAGYQNSKIMTYMKSIFAQVNNFFNSSENIEREPMTEEEMMEHIRQMEEDRYMYPMM